MAYIEKVKIIMSKIPKEHHKNVRKIMNIFYKEGVFFCGQCKET